MLLGGAGPEVKQQLAFTLRGSDRREVSRPPGGGGRGTRCHRTAATLPVRTKRARPLIEYILFSIASHV